MIVGLCWITFVWLMSMKMCLRSRIKVSLSLLDMGLRLLDNDMAERRPLSNWDERFVSGAAMILSC
jgi:hypothetical protein